MENVRFFSHFCHLSVDCVYGLHRQTFVGILVASVFPFFPISAPCRLLPQYDVLVGCVLCFGSAAHIFVILKVPTRQKGRFRSRGAVGMLWKIFY
jgi:hypothetical protein